MRIPWFQEPAIWEALMSGLSKKRWVWDARHVNVLRPSAIGSRLNEGTLKLQNVVIELSVSQLPISLSDLRKVVGNDTVITVIRANTSNLEAAGQLNTLVKYSENPERLLSFKCAGCDNDAPEEGCSCGHDWV